MRMHHLPINHCYKPFQFVTVITPRMHSDKHKTTSEVVQCTLSTSHGQTPRDDDIMMMQGVLTMLPIVIPLQQFNSFVQPSQQHTVLIANG